MDEIQTGTTILDPSGLGSNGHEGGLHSPLQKEEVLTLYWVCS